MALVVEVIRLRSAAIPVAAVLTRLPPTARAARSGPAGHELALDLVRPPTRRTTGWPMAYTATSVVRSCDGVALRLFGALRATVAYVAVARPATRLGLDHGLRGPRNLCDGPGLHAQTAHLLALPAGPLSKPATKGQTRPSTAPSLRADSRWTRAFRPMGGPGAEPGGDRVVLSAVSRMSHRSGSRDGSDGSHQHRTGTTAVPPVPAHAPQRSAPRVR